MQDKIKAVLEQHFLNKPLSYNPLRHLDTAAEAIAELVAARHLTTRAADLILLMAELGDDNPHTVREYVKEARRLVDAGGVTGQVVDRVQAMAALTRFRSPATYYVPDGKVGPMLVTLCTGGFECVCAKPDCDHIRAVEIFIARQGEGNDGD